MVRVLRKKQKRQRILKLIYFPEGVKVVENFSNRKALHKRAAELKLMSPDVVKRKVKNSSL